MVNLGLSVAGPDGCIGVIPALKDVSVVTVSFRLALVSGVFAGRSNVTVRYVSRISGLGEGVHPVVVFVEDLDALSLAYGQLLVAARRVVAYGRHTEVRRAVARGFVEHLSLERTVVSCVSRLIAALVARSVRRGAVVARGAGTVLVVLHVTVPGRGERVIIVVLVMCVRWCVMIVETVVIPVPEAARALGGHWEGGCGAALTDYRSLQLLRHGCAGDIARDNLVKQLHSGRQHKVRLAVLTFLFRTVLKRGRADQKMVSHSESSTTLARFFSRI